MGREKTQAFISKMQRNGTGLFAGRDLPVEPRDATTTITDGVDIAASYAVDNVTAPILSLGFGLCEKDVSEAETAFFQMLWQRAAAEGITVSYST